MQWDKWRWYAKRAKNVDTSGLCDVDTDGVEGDFDTNGFKSDVDSNGIKIDVDTKEIKSDVDTNGV